MTLAWGGTPKELLRPKLVASSSAPHLFDDAYLLTLSTVPADRQATAPPTPASEREAFLGDLLSSMTEARLLLILGRPDETAWNKVEEGYWERAAEIIQMLMPERPPPR